MQYDRNLRGEGGGGTKSCAQAFVMSGKTRNNFWHADAALKGNMLRLKAPLQTVSCAEAFGMNGTTCKNFRHADAAFKGNVLRLKVPLGGEPSHVLQALA